MVSTTEVGGNNPPNSKANWKKNKLKSGHVPKFIGSATSNSVLHGKVVTNGSNQAGQLLVLVNSLFSYIAEQQLPNWAESLRNMVRKPQADFMPTRVRKSNYGNPGDIGEFIWNAPAVDTKEDYINDTTVWKTGQVSGMKQYQDYVNNGEYIMLAIQGQVEPSLWDKTRGDIRFAAIQTAKCPIDLMKLMKEQATGTQSGLWLPLAYITHL